MTMKKYLPLFVLLLAVLACNVPSVVPPTLPPGPDSAGETPAMGGPAAGSTGTGTLSLLILSPLDGAVVTTPSVEIVGKAPAGAVISIDDDILIVGVDGQFKHVVSLQEGPNVIEILASDAQGHEAHLFLSVFYEP